MQTVIDHEVDAFEASGRCKPLQAAGSAFKVRGYFKCSQPKIDYAAIYRRVATHLGSPQISVEEFERRAQRIRSRIEDQVETAGLLNAVAVPILLPKATHVDLRSALNDHYVPAVAAAFAETLPEYRFVNHHPVDEELQVHPGCRHQQLLQRLQQEDVVAYWFAAFAEYSIPAARQRESVLPEDFMLAGGVDTAAALVACPDLLLREDGYPPLLWLAALSSARDDAGYFFEAYGYNLTFNHRPHFNQAAEYWNSGLVVLG
jgi:hypothetical protein